jgi:hypothetical protein
MNRALIVVAVSLLALAPACRRHRTAEAPPPPAQPLPPPPPPPPCDVIGSWEAMQTFTPQQIDVSPTEKVGVFNVRVRNGANLGVATIQTNSSAPVDTSVTNPLYRCQVAEGNCNVMTCSFTGGAAPVSWKRIQ